MFTGLIETQGVIVSCERTAGGSQLLLSSALPVTELSNGESIAVDGVCLTVTSFSDKGFAVDVSPESLAATTLGAKKVGAQVNLERALKLSDRLGGHLVSGHVDGQATLQSVRRTGEFTRLDFKVPKALLACMIVKGSVAIDGISLTLNTVDTGGFSVMIIPHTLVNTTLCDRTAGERVNIENDMIGKYVEKFIRSGSAGGVTRELLEKNNFMQS
jgi:riboflavin synthase